MDDGVPVRLERNPRSVSITLGTKVGDLPGRGSPSSRTGMSGCTGRGLTLESTTIMSLPFAVTMDGPSYDTLTTLQ